MPDVSVIISFYNKIDYLKLLLAGFERQSFRSFEIIIGDDGSKEDVTEEIEKLTTKLSFPLKHLWQEDKGFRKNKMLNKTITAAAAPYLIFIDGDCVPHKEFVKEHTNAAQGGFCLTGRRVNLSSKITADLSEKNVSEGFLEKSLSLIPDGLFGNSYDVEKGFYFKSNILRNYFNKKKRGLLGCNFSIHKEEILKINGFDERYEAPSIGEDTDIQFRLELNGVKIKSLNNIAVQYHLYHKLQERPQINLNLFEEVKKSRVAFTPYGIIKQ
ncbi:MAG: glycosyltransferase [Ignavibacteriaceae bacterium]|nr:glycosyltransferase [Ignavibacteriaceae bacterium]